MDSLEPVQPRPLNSLPVILLASAVLVVIFIFGLLSGVGPEVALDEDVPFAGVERLTLNQAYVAFLQAEAVFVDVRPLGDYNAGHIPQSISIPMTALDGRYTRLEPEAWIILYGEAVNEADSGAAAEFLMEQGFEHVSALFGGIQAWTTAGHPVDP